MLREGVSINTSEIQAGTDWSSEICKKLNSIDLAVILISPDALASDFIVERELPALIQRQRAGGLVGVPVLLRPSPWTAVEGLADLQFANPSATSPPRLNAGRTPEGNCFFAKKIPIDKKICQ